MLVLQPRQSTLRAVRRFSVEQSFRLHCSMLSTFSILRVTEWELDPLHYAVGKDLSWPQRGIHKLWFISCLIICMQAARMPATFLRK
jgi:hypothetical protein